MTLIITGILISYSLLTLVFWLAWLRLKPVMAKDVTNTLKLSVVVVVRNEEENIINLLQDIERQSLPAEFIEVWVVDDHSTDRTAALATAFIQRASYSLHVLPLAHFIDKPLTEGNYKKKAIELAVSQATGELIVCTDGDCHVGPHWLKTIANHYLQTKAKLISGPVTFFKEQSFFEKLQTVEFASLIGSGAALLKLGIPAMCNGANLAFTKDAFNTVGGYRNTSSTATGDDVFLLQKIHKAYPGEVTFLKCREAIVYTQAKSKIAGFVEQRKRWASKWNLYIDRRVSYLAVFIFISNFSVLLALMLLLSGNYSLRMFLIQITIKFSAEFVFLTSVLTFFRKADFVRFIVPLQAIYFLYVSFFGIVTHKKGYSWKGRKFS